jgi:hypothetical protein
VQLAPRVRTERMELTAHREPKDRSDRKVLREPPAQLAPRVRMEQLAHRELRGRSDRKV